MVDIEQRLNALEKRARIDDERWQSLNAQQNAIPIIWRMVLRPVCAANPALLATIILNLKTCEKEFRRKNEHTALIREFRRTRSSFESLAGIFSKKISNPDRPRSQGEPPRKKK
jgi:hypothetical protein